MEDVEEKVIDVAVPVEHLLSLIDDSAIASSRSTPDTRRLTRFLQSTIWRVAARIL